MSQDAGLGGLGLPSRDLSQAPGPAHLRGLAGVMVTRAGYAAPGPRRQDKWLSACMTILGPKIYVTGTWSLNSWGQRGIWVDRNLKIELE